MKCLKCNNRNMRYIEKKKFNDTTKKYKRESDKTYCKNCDKKEKI